MNTSPPTCCETYLPEKGWVAASAAVWPNQGAAPLKLNIKFPKQALHDALWSARMAERGNDARWMVEINIERALSGEEIQAAQFPAILADRLARGLPGGLSPEPGRKLIALGQSVDWIEGRIGPLPWHETALQALCERNDLGETQILLPTPPDAACAALHQAIQDKHPSAILRELDSLDELLGHPTPGAACRRTRGWFPIVSGNRPDQDSLLEVEVVLRRAAARTDEDRIVVSGLLSRKPQDGCDPKSALLAWRRDDRHGLHEWDSLIRFNSDFQGDSYQLALALADRIARGREFPASGRLIATGKVNEAGEVKFVEGIERKCALILREIQVGDRVLLPWDWKDTLPADFLADVTAAGASCALIQRVKTA